MGTQFGGPSKPTTSAQGAGGNRVCVYGEVVFAQIHLVCQLHPFLDCEALANSHMDYYNTLYMWLHLKATQKLHLV